MMLTCDLTVQWCFQSKRTDEPPHDDDSSWLCWCQSATPDPRDRVPQPAAAWRWSLWEWAAAWRSWCRRSSPTWASLRTSASCWWSKVLLKGRSVAASIFSVNFTYSTLSQGGQPFRKWSGTRWRAQHHRAAPGLLWPREYGVAAERRAPDWGGWAEGRC